MSHLNTANIRRIFDVCKFYLNYFLFYMHFYYIINEMMISLRITQ